MLMLHIGCGDVHLEGWVNIDLDSPKADLLHDMRQPLPFGDGSVDYIYSEHFIEHLTIDEGLFTLRECYRVLKPAGVVRIATVDLRYVLFRYFFGWRHQDWIERYGYAWLKTPAEMVNLVMREWQHKHVYDAEELWRRLREAGFTRIKRARLNRSPYAPLRARETRKDSRLIVEASK